MVTTPSSNPTTNVTGTNAPESSSSRSAAGLSIDRDAAATLGAVELDDCGADEVVDPEGVRVVDRFGVQAGVGVPLGGGAIGESREAHQPALRLAGGVGDRQPFATTPESRSRVEPLRAVGRQVDVHVAAEPVRPGDAADLEQALRRLASCSSAGDDYRSVKEGAAEAARANSPQSTGRPVPTI